MALLPLLYSASSCCFLLLSTKLTTVCRDHRMPCRADNTNPMPPSPAVTARVKASMAKSADNLKVSRTIAFRLYTNKHGNFQAIYLGDTC